METNKKLFYFNGVANTNVFIYNSNFVGRNIDIENFIDTFDCSVYKEFNTSLKYKLNEDIYIDSLNENGELVQSKIEYILKKEGNEDTLLYDVEYNGDVVSISNLAVYDKKKSKIVISPLKDIEQKFIIQNVGNFINLDIDCEIDLSDKTTLGFIIGYWLIRGGFHKVDDDSYICFRGKEEDSQFISNILSKLIPNYTSFNKKSVKNLEYLIIINNELQKLLSEKFNKKNLPDWVVQLDNEILKGIFYSFIYCRSYLSKDKDENTYLVLSNKNKEILNTLKYILKRKFGIYSKFISNNENLLSFKINQKLNDILMQGNDLNLISVDFEYLNISQTKEFFIKEYNYKIIPWYKLKYNKNEDITTSYTFKLENNKIYMLSNGLFVLS